MLGVAMMCSAAASLFAQSVVVQRTTLPPFRLLQLALPLLTVAFLVMAFSESRWTLTGAMVIQGFAMGMAGPAFTAGASLAVEAREQGAVAGIIASCGPLGVLCGSHCRRHVVSIKTRAALCGGRSHICRFGPIYGSIETLCDIALGILANKTPAL